MYHICFNFLSDLPLVLISENLIKRHTAHCEASINNHEPQAMVDNTSAIARLANRVLMVAKQEADNSEDPMFVAKVNSASDQLQAGTWNRVNTRCNLDNICKFCKTHDFIRF